MIQAIVNFFNSENFMPHGHCFLWQPDILWLHVISDVGIAAAYFAIPFALLYFVRKRKDLPFQAVFVLFGAFIFLCGTSHVMDIWVLWHPDYAMQGIILALTAIISIATFFMTVKLIPQALLLPSPSQLAKVNAELNAANHQLEILYKQSQESGQAQLLNYTKALERSNQELDDFAYIASHDLKEPLRGLHNHASFLLEDYQDKLDESGVQRLKRLGQLSQRMEQLVDELLYFSRLGRTELAIQECDPNKMISEIGQLMETFLKERNAHIVIPKPMPRVVCDKPRITEVFRNLITNAVKYNDKKERIVEVGFLESVNAPHGKEKNVFYVKDNGIGIEREFYGEIFRIFKRLQNPVGGEETGTGAGLTFVKKIIDRHKGRIWLESEPGKGTVFYFTVSGNQA